MEQSIRLIVFDWDGTLMDSEAKIVASMRAAGEDLGLASLDDRTLRNVIGLGLKEAIEALYPRADSETHRAFADRYRHHFLSGEGEDSTLFEGALELLRGLQERGLLLGVATGKSRRGLNRVLAEHECGGFFHATRCADETFSKPHPQMLLEIMDELGAAPQETVMIGDTEYDLQMAKNAGAHAVGVSYGVHERERLLKLQPLACADNIRNLMTWLNRYGTGGHGL
ncbi:MAG: HAD-IA family hydrolase [Gammaproteobacteria bacterium]|jgi:phosphoglycolate phosphatase